MPNPYRVEARIEGCPSCQHGASYEIVGPDEIAQSQSWGELEDAEYICELMNEAYAAGRASFAAEVLALTERDKQDATCEDEGLPPVTTQEAEAAQPPDDIPF